jgi:hypothetical protein
MPPCQSGIYEQAVSEARLPSPPCSTGQCDTQGRRSSGPCSQSVFSAFAAECAAASRQGRRQQWRRARELSHSFQTELSIDPCVPERFIDLVQQCKKTAASQNHTKISDHMAELINLRSNLSRTGDRLAILYINAGLIMLSLSRRKAKQFKKTKDSSLRKHGTAT